MAARKPTGTETSVSAWSDRGWHFQTGTRRLQVWAGRTRGLWIFGLVLQRGDGDGDPEPEGFSVALRFGPFYLGAGWTRVAG